MRRESRYIQVARLALQIAEASLPCYSHANSPQRYTLPQRVACVVLMFYVDVSYRDMEEWLLASDGVMRVLGLSEVPDHTTLWRTYRRLTQADWQRLQRQLLDGLQVAEEAIAIDTTHFRLEHASAYFMTRRGRRYREWVKGGYAVGTTSQLIVGSCSGREIGYDQPYLARLRRQIGRYGRHEGHWRAWELLGDMGFDGKTTRPDDLIPPQRRNHDIVAPARKTRADLVSAARLEGLYGQRWKVETVNSVMKRKFGDTIRSRSVRLQRREPLVKAFVYNLHV